MRLTLKGAQNYWYHAGLVSILEKKTGWDRMKAKNFAAQNQIINFNGITRESAATLLNELEAAGFEIQLEEMKQDITASIALPYGTDLAAIKKDLGELTERLTRLETSKTATQPWQSVKDSPVYQNLVKEEVKKVEPKSPIFIGKNEKEKAWTPKSETSPKEDLRENSTESTIGTYWLSRIGIFTLVLGIVLFISYSFQFIGPWGKISTGLAVGASLIGLGDYFTKKEKYQRWAMAIMGGGWAVVYFTVYAAYQIPVTKVINNPLVGFGWLLAVIIGSISHSLRFKSQVLVFFSYFLGFVAITMVEVSFYTLLASFLLGVSIVIVTKKMGWSWLALLGLAAVYLTHYFWLAPLLAATSYSGAESWIDALALPWVGEEWRIYPLMATEKSLIHQAFLVLYWLLFTTIGFFKNEKQEKQNLTFWLLLLNSFIFTSSYIHHLHVYYPSFKYMFPFVMGFVFLILCLVEQKLKRPLLSDLCLAFSVSLFALTIPMYFDGPWVTYGWTFSSVILTWLGLRHHRTVLYRIAWVLAGMVLWRLVNFDYAERDILFHIIMPVRSSFLLFTVAALGFLSNFGIYRISNLQNEREKRISENCFLIATSLALAWAFLMGGLRAASSVFWVLEGIILMILGVRMQRTSVRVFSILFMAFAAIRLATVDCGLEIAKIVSDPKTAIRLIAAGLSIVSILGLSDWLRRKVKTIDFKDWIFSCSLTIGGALLVLRYLYDSGISSWVSIIWGICAFAFIVSGFAVRDCLYRWCGLGIFAMVLLRLFFHDFSALETIYRIVSFIALGAVLIGASFIYNYYSKLLLEDSGK